jgi:hypothetical protein
MPAPRPRTSTVRDPLAIEAVSLDDGRGLELYLHMKEGVAPAAEARALVGFVLAEIALGDPRELALPPTTWPRDTRPLAARVERAVRADSYTGQPAIVAAMLVDGRGHEAELEAIAADEAKSGGTRALAAIVARALRGKAWSAGDWALVEAARADVDRRTLWAWALMLVSDGEEAARIGELKRRVPLSDEETRSFFREWVAGATR